MYNTKVVCTYHTPEVFLDTDIVSEDDKFFIRNVIYRQELLDILGLNEYNENEMNTVICELYEKIQHCDDLKECMNKVAEKFMITDSMEFGLILLYAYDYMYLTHICVSEFIETGKIDKNNILQLKSLLF
jgi:hypothetical protein